MKEMARKAGLECTVSSAATTTEELGNDIYPNAKTELKRRGIPFERHSARKIRSDEYADWDLIIAMDEENLSDIQYIVGPDTDRKVRLLMSFTGEEKPISDPWYTRDFARAYDDIYRGCEGLLVSLMKRNNANER